VVCAFARGNAAAPTIHNTVVAVSTAETNFLEFIFNLIYRLIIGIDLFGSLWNP
jgi:hypothetical protein